MSINQVKPWDTSMYASSIDDLRNIDAISGYVVHLRSYYAGGSFGGGTFICNGEAGTVEDDGGINIVTSTGMLFVRQDKTLLSTSFGVEPGSTADQSTKLQSVIDLGNAQQKPVFLVGSVYAEVTATGYADIRGMNNAYLHGNLTYQELNFPIAADSNVFDGSEVFFNCQDIKFKSVVATRYALRIVAQAGYSFIDVFRVSNCKFYGRYGAIVLNAIGSEFLDCRFFNWNDGIIFLGVANINVSRCWFRNAARYGVKVANNPDAPNRVGGENVRFVQCEFAVCSRGVMLVCHVWCTITACLFDYCILPLECYGSYHGMVSDSYLGSSIQGSLTSREGYEAPPTVGCAIYMHGFGGGTSVTAGSFYAGMSIVNCKLVSYASGQTIPLVYASGYISATENYLINSFTMSNCVLIASNTHSMSHMLNANYAANVSIMGTDFISEDKSTSLVGLYDLSNCKQTMALGNLSSKCTQNGVVVKDTFMGIPSLTTQKIKAKSGSSILLESADGGAVLGIGTDNIVMLEGVDVRSTAGSLQGYKRERVNGGIVRIPYYADSNT